MRFLILMRLLILMRFLILMRLPCPPAYDPAGGFDAKISSFPQLLNSIPMPSRPFKIFFMAAVISASSSVLSLARKVME